MRIVFALLVTLAMASAQVAPPPPPPARPAAESTPAPPAAESAPAPPAAETPPVSAPATPPVAAPPPPIEIAIAPLAPPDLDSPYASVRDAARHWFQTTLANLREQRDIRNAVRGFAQAFLTDRTYAAAAFNLGIMAAIDEKWEDAAAALEEASRLDPRLGAQAKSPLERIRLLASLEKTPDGRRRRRYDEALHGLLTVLPEMTPSDALKSLALLGRIDPARWEVPALLAGLGTNRTGYDVSAQFLTIAAKNATEPAIKARLQGALDAAQREVRYASARYSAETAAEGGKYAEAAASYENAWSTVPARAVNAMQAASARLLSDDTVQASAVLLRLRESGDPEFSKLAAAMLKELEAVEPAAKGSAGDVGQFFRDRGSAQPPRIADLIPMIDRADFEIYGRPLPRLVDDTQPVVLLASLSAEPNSTPTNIPLPPLPPPSIAGDRPWSELKTQFGRPAAITENKPERPLQAANLAGNARVRHVILVTTEPAGAKVFTADSPDAICETPCSVQVGEGKYPLLVSLPGYQSEQQTVLTAGADREFRASLRPVRGSIVVDTPTPVALTINGTAAAANAPAELLLLPGVYRIGADLGSGLRERVVNLKPGARLRLEWR